VILVEVTIVDAGPKRIADKSGRPGRGVPNWQQIPCQITKRATSLPLLFDRAAARERLEALHNNWAIE
jgi:hypothetical protein